MTASKLFQARWPPPVSIPDGQWGALETEASAYRIALGALQRWEDWGQPLESIIQAFIHAADDTQAM